MLEDIGGELHLLLPRGLGAFHFVVLKKETPVIAQHTNGPLGLRSHQDQIQPAPSGDTESFTERFHAGGLLVVIQQKKLLDLDGFVDEVRMVTLRLHL